jgi:hypothetical protein
MNSYGDMESFVWMESCVKAFLCDVCVHLRCSLTQHGHSEVVVVDLSGARRKMLARNAKCASEIIYTCILWEHSRYWPCE